MICPFIIGKKIHLRALQKSDIGDKYLGWVNDPEVNQYLFVGMFPTTLEKLESYYQQMATCPNNIILAIVIKKTDEYIGNIALNNINWVNRNVDMGIMIGNKKSWGHGYGTEAVSLIVDYCFQKLNLHKVGLSIHASNKSAIKVYRRVGFVEEGILKDELYTDGAYYDKLIMGMRRRDGC